MAPQPSASASTNPARSRDSGPAAAWAVVWLGGLAAALWVPLLLENRQPGAPTGHLSRPASSGTDQLLSRPPLSPAPGPLPTLPLQTSTENGIAGRGPQPLLPALAPPMNGPSAGSPHTAPPPLAPVAMMPSPPISGALLLGGPLDLESLKERPMLPAARMEQALRAASADRLEAVPLHWRPAMQALLRGTDRVLPAEVVRLPAPHLKAPEDYPMVVKPDGMAETTVTPSPQSKATLERWAERQAATATGSARPVMVVLEPIETGSQTKLPR